MTVLRAVWPQGENKPSKAEILEDPLNFNNRKQGLRDKSLLAAFMLQIKKMDVVELCQNVGLGYF